MKTQDLGELLLLAAIWGASFLFMRVAAPEFGPLPMAWLRVAGAGLLLLPLLAWRGEAAALRAQAPRIALLGLTNSALPFACYGYAALALPAGLSAIFNAATPLFTALLAWAWLGDALSRWRVLGLGLGFAGVVTLALLKSGLGAGRLDTAAALAVAACVAATLMYAHGACYTRSRLQGVPALALATGSQLSAALALALPAALSWPAQTPGLLAWLSAAALALLCSGLAYILYFRLLARVGPTQAASVTFLIPLFATLWGTALLDEVLSRSMAAGGAMIIGGTVLALGLWPRRARG